MVRTKCVLLGYQFTSYLGIVRHAVVFCTTGSVYAVPVEGGTWDFCVVAHTGYVLINEDARCHRDIVATYVRVLKLGTGVNRLDSRVCCVCIRIHPTSQQELGLASCATLQHTDTDCRRWRLTVGWRLLD